MISQRLKKQIEFLLEADKMKSLYRQTYIINDETRGMSMRDFEGENDTHKRRENDAEHSFHLALFAMVLVEHSNVPVNLERVMKTVLIHDIVEIDAGDTYCYDNKGYESKAERECRAAERLFGLLPDDQRDEFRTLWDEFEKMETAEARFAAALDRMQPMLLNYTKNGISWQEHNISYSQVYSRNKHIANGSEDLWEYMENALDDALGKGFLRGENTDKI